MPEPFTLCEHEVAHVCGYITDDGTVANYFGIPRRQVKSIRSKIPKRAQRNASHFLDKDIAPLGRVQGMNAWIEDGIIGSERLKNELHKFFRRFEAQNNLQEGAAQILLPAGWSGK